MSALPPGPPPAAGPPPGPYIGPPGNAATPAGAGGGFTLSWKAVAIALLVVLVGLGIVIAVAFSGDDKASAQPVMLEPISSSGQNPFMPSVGTDQGNVTPPAQSAGTFAGNTPGLYGGTLNRSSCDATQMVTFLEQNPDKGRAWADVLGISTTSIRSYVNELTPVVLRADVSVTNHGYENGRATTIPAVLEAGTAVLVDKYGFPVVKCYCGNPLTRRRVYPEPTYTGSRWSRFSPTSITVIQQTTIVIDIFTLVDPATGQSFTRPRGTSGTTDRPTTPPPPTPTTTTTTTATTLPPAPQPSQPQGPSAEERAAAKVDQAARQCYPFPAPIEDSTSSSKSFESGSNPDSFVIQVTTQTVSGGTQVFRWAVNRNTLQFTPVNNLAQVASNHCPLLN